MVGGHAYRNSSRNKHVDGPPLALSVPNVAVVKDPTVNQIFE